MSLLPLIILVIVCVRFEWKRIWFLYRLFMSVLLLEIQLPRGGDGWDPVTKRRRWLGSSYQEEEMVGIPLIGLTTYPFIPISGP
jgi:hypothetical protein